MGVHIMTDNPVRSGIIQKQLENTPKIKLKACKSLWSLISKKLFHSQHGRLPERVAELNGIR